MKTMFDKLAPMVVRPEAQAQDVEIWQPQWQCFCCHDSGIIRPHLAQMVIDGYQWDKHKLPLCQKPGCRMGSHYYSEAMSATTDTRVLPPICKKLDEIERDNWNRTVQSHWQRAKQSASELARDMSLRKRDRTQAEQQQAEENHQFWRRN